MNKFVSINFDILTFSELFSPFYYMINLLGWKIQNKGGQTFMTRAKLETFFSYWTARFKISVTSYIKTATVGSFGTAPKIY